MRLTLGLAEQQPRDSREAQEEMSRNKTSNIPDLTVLLMPQTPIMLAVEHAILPGHEWSRATAPVAEQIAVRLAGAITMDLIHAGQRLLETEIGEVLRVSRAPVREALRILERERLVEFQARRGAIVTAPDAKDLRDIYLVRTSLYRIFMRRLMDKHPAEAQAVFERHMPNIIKTAQEHSVDSYVLETFRLNMALLELSDNQLVGELLASTSLRTLRYIRLGLAADPERVVISVKNWRALQRAVVRRNLDEILEMTYKRLDASRDAAIRAIVPPTAPTRSKSTSGPARPRPSAPSRPPSARLASRRRSPAA